MAVCNAITSISSFVLIFIFCASATSFLELVSSYFDAFAYYLHWFLLCSLCCLIRYIFLYFFVWSPPFAHSGKWLIYGHIFFFFFASLCRCYRRLIQCHLIIIIFRGGTENNIKHCTQTLCRPKFQSHDFAVFFFFLFSLFILFTIVKVRRIFTKN